MEKITGTCPGCRKRCDLATPRCHVGEAYARTGLLPGGKKHKDRKEPSEVLSGKPVGETDQGLPKEEPALEDLLADKLRAVSRGIRHGEGTLEALSADEKEQLRSLLDKASAGWGQIHHGHPAHEGHHKHDHEECGHDHKEKRGHEECDRDHKEKHGYHGKDKH